MTLVIRVTDEPMTEAEIAEQRERFCRAWEPLVDALLIRYGRPDVAKQLMDGEISLAQAHSLLTKIKPKWELPDGAEF